MLKNLSWNVCTPIASKYECKKNMMANVKLETNAKNEKNIFLELNKNDLSTIL